MDPRDAAILKSIFQECTTKPLPATYVRVIKLSLVNFYTG